MEGSSETRSRRPYPGKRIRQAENQQLSSHAPAPAVPPHTSPRIPPPPARTVRFSTEANSRRTGNNANRSSSSNQVELLAENNKISAKDTTRPYSSGEQNSLPVRSTEMSLEKIPTSPWAGLTAHLVTTLITLMFMVLLPIVVPRDYVDPAQPEYVPQVPLFSALDSWSGWIHHVKHQSDIAIVGGPEARVQAERLIGQVHANISHQVRLRIEVDRACEPLWIELVVAQESRDLSRWQHAASRFHNLISPVEADMDRFLHGLDASLQYLKDLDQSVEMDTGQCREKMRNQRKYKTADGYKATYTQYQDHKTAHSFIEQCSKIVANGKLHLRARQEKEARFYTFLATSTSLPVWEVRRDIDGRWTDPHIKLVDEARRLAESELPLWLNGTNASFEET